MKRVAFYTLGCKVNQYESEAMEELFLQAGYRLARADEPVDVFVVNTCTVTHVSDAKCRQAIRRVKRQNPLAVIAVVGCYVQVAAERVRAMEGVDILIGTKGRGHIVEDVEAFLAEGKPIMRIPDLKEEVAFDSLSISRELSTTRAAVKIQEGCDMYCSYCIIPYARGPIASRSQDEILEEVKRLLAHGIQEIVLTGIHVASYGKEAGRGEDLVDLVEALSVLPGLARIRLSSIEPRWVNEEKLIRMRDCGKLCDHFHLSLQSGSDAVLRAMNRKYDRALYAEKLATIRSIFPSAGLTTDVIVGFPGERESDFQATLDFCQAMAFSKIHIFPYSPRQGTPAALFQGQVDPAVKKERAQRLAQLERKLRHDFMDRSVGQPVDVLFEEGADPTLMYGYTSNYLRVQAPRDENRVNRIMSGKITGRVGEILIFQADSEGGNHV